MKKTLLFVAALLTAGAMMAQTMVSTQVEKRNIVLEELTGVNCGYCPDGHAVANALCEQYGGHAWAINIHTGGYATGSGYTTTYGDGIAAIFANEVDGYPIGTVNRTTMQSRGQWASRAAQIRAENSPVNLAGSARLDGRTYTLHLEVYYTGNDNESTNLLNIAVLQNNILGYQSNYGNYNPDYIEGSQYRHMHMFRDLLMGQWGISIPATQGYFLDTTIVYEVPANISGLAITDPEDLEFVAFITRNNHKNIISGTKFYPFTETPVLTSINVDNEDCSLDYQPYVTIHNTSEYEFISFTFNYDGEEVTVNKSIASMHEDTLHLPAHTITVSGDPVQHCTTTKSISLYSCMRVDGQMFTPNGDTKSTTFAEFDIYTVAGPFEAKVGIDYAGTECSLSLLDQSNCNTLWTDGDDWSDLNINWNQIQYINQLPNARYYHINFDPAAGLYILRMNDAAGDGWYWTNNTVPSGLWLNNEGGEIFAFSQGYSAGEEFVHKDFYLNVTSNGDGSHNYNPVGIDNVAGLNFSVYPNPTTDLLNIECEQAISLIEVLDMAGRTVMSQNGNASSISTQALSEGVYMLRVITEAGVSAQKFVKE